MKVIDSFSAITCSTTNAARNASLDMPLMSCGRGTVIGLKGMLTIDRSNGLPAHRFGRRITPALQL